MRFTILGLSCNVYSMTYCLSKRVEELSQKKLLDASFDCAQACFLIVTVACKRHLTLNTVLVSIKKNYPG